MHLLFLTRYGIHLAVFDMREIIGRDKFKKKPNRKDFEL